MRSLSKNNIRNIPAAFFVLLGCLLFPACGNAPESTVFPKVAAAAFSLDELQHRTFQYFWEQADTGNFQVPDRYPTRNFSSIAATGFGLTGYLVGVDQGYITREQAAERVLNTLRALKDLPQGDAKTGVGGYRGFFYHFLLPDEATRFKQVELSTIDTGLLMAGILSAQSFFDGENAVEKEIRETADFLYRRVEWDWAMNDEGSMSMGWSPEHGFLDNAWHGYNEAMILLVLALGSPTHPIPASSWEKWCETYQWAEYQGQEYVNFDPLFGHQYSQMYIDFKGIQDAFMRQKGIDYFENSRRATYANRAWCTENPNKFTGYSENCWGLTACDGPSQGSWQTTFEGRVFRSYSARGPASIDGFDDGTIAPTAAGGSLPFAPEICLPALKFMWENYYQNLVGEYGFKDAFNLTYTLGEGNESGWFDKDYIGIDQGPILIQIQNHRNGFVWEVMKKNEYLQHGLKKAGFTGSWMASK